MDGEIIILKFASRFWNTLTPRKIFYYPLLNEPFFHSQLTEIVWEAREKVWCVTARSASTRTWVQSLTRCGDA